MVRNASSSRDVYAHLARLPMADQVGAVARVAVGECVPGEALGAYLPAIRSALDAAPPPFGTDAYRDVYRDASANPTWMVLSLARNSQREGQGASDLWTLAASAADPGERQLIKRHAVDESRHAKVYLALLDLAFPDAVEPGFRRAMDAFSPDYGMGQELAVAPGSLYARNPTVDDFVQMNIAEIRTTIHHLMQRAALEAHCPPANLPRAVKLMNSLLRDELGHVAYTAVLVERKAARMGPGGLERLFDKRVRDFNRITSEEMARAVYA